MARYNDWGWFIILAGLFSCVTANAGEDWQMSLEKQFSGVMAHDQTEAKPDKRLNYGSIKLAGYPNDCLYEQTSAGMRFFVLKNNRWEKLNAAISLENEKAGELGNVVSMTIGDIDNDGNDEVLCAHESGDVLCYRWDGFGFQIEKYQYFHTIDQMIIGDITNDGRNELVMFTIRRWQTKRGVPESPYRLVVGKIQDGTIREIWSDEHQFHFNGYGVFPEDKIQAIADYNNTGQNKLMIELSQSDVCPTRYKNFQWDGEKLIVEDLFYISEWQLKTEAGMAYERAPFICTGLDPVKYKQITYLYAPVWDSGNPLMLFHIQNKEIDFTFDLFGPVSRRNADKVIWFDLAGEGKGLLRLHSDKEENLYYDFYLLRDQSFPLNHLEVD